MAKVRFKTNTPNHSRELSKADFASLGVEEQGKTTFSGSEGTEVPDNVAAALVDKLGDEFEIVEEKEQTAQADAGDDGSGDAGDAQVADTTTTTGGGSRDGAGARTARTR